MLYSIVSVVHSLNKRGYYYISPEVASSKMQAGLSMFHYVALSFPYTQGHAYQIAKGNVYGKAKGNAFENAKGNAFNLSQGCPVTMSRHTK